MSQGRKPKRSGQGRQRNRRRYGGPRKANLIEQSKKELLEYNQRANDRFEYEKTGLQPVGLPDDPSDANSFSFTWKCNPVRLSDEEKMADFVVRRGEFGWLDDDRVDEAREEEGHPTIGRLALRPLPHPSRRNHDHEGNQRDEHGKIGIDEEEQEELAIVEADRVHHPRAEMVHVECQPLRHRVEVRSRRLVQARTPTHCDITAVGHFLRHLSLIHL